VSNFHANRKNKREQLVSVHTEMRVFVQDQSMQKK